MRNDVNIRTSFRLAPFPAYLLEKMKALTGKAYKELLSEMFRKELRNIVTQEKIQGFDLNDAKSLSVDTAVSSLGLEGERKTFVISKDTHHAIRQASKVEDCSIDEVVNAHILVLAYANDLAVLEIHERRIARFDTYVEILFALEKMNLEIGTYGILGGPDDEHWFHGKDYEILTEVESMLDSLEQVVVCKNTKLVDYNYFFNRKAGNN